MGFGAVAAGLHRAPSAAAVLTIVDKEPQTAIVSAFAQARGHSLLELAFSWLATRPQVSSVIAGATRVEQVEQYVKAIGWALSAQELAEVDKITN